MIAEHTFDAFDRSFLSACMSHRTTLVVAMVAEVFSAAHCKSATTAGATGTSTGISFCLRSHTCHTDAQECYCDGAGRSMQQPLQQASSLSKALLMNRDSAAECRYDEANQGHCRLIERLWAGEQSPTCLSLLWRLLLLLPLLGHADVALALHGCHGLSCNQDTPSLPGCCS